MKKIINIYILLLLSLCLGSEFEPMDGAELKYTQVFLSWPQISGAEGYTLELNSELGSVTINTSGNSYLELNYFDWGKTYVWEVCASGTNNLATNCYEQKTFSISSLPLYVPDYITILESNPLIYKDGISVLDLESLNFSIALDMQGAPIWFVDPEPFQNSRLVVTNFLDNGNFTAFGPGVGYEIDRNGEIVFQSPPGYAIHHDFNKTSMGTYLMVTGETQYHPCPDECPDGLPDLIPWQGDRFIELDTDGSEIWSWSTFDNYSLEEYNPIYIESFAGATNFDWTHSNSARYDHVSDAIFISARNLSRITKIDYSTGEHVWDLGRNDLMDQTYFDEDFNFSQQHSVQILESGNILFFDNHRYLDPELSRCVEIAYDDSYNAQLVWEYVLPESMFTGSRGECDRLDNGNTLITAGRTGNVLEVSHDGSIAWHLKVKNNNFDVTIYRTDRVTNLYPVAFSIAINRFMDGGIVYDQNSELSGILFSSGWGQDIFDINLYINDQLVSVSSISIDGQVNPFLIDLVNYEYDDQDEFKVSINPRGMDDLSRSVSFKMSDQSDNILGDLNSDGILNVLDIVIIINAIVGLIDLSEVQFVIADLNDDGLVNILDVVQLVNLIVGI